VRPPDKLNGRSRAIAARRRIVLRRPVLRRLVAFA
jgi:hypothetical protein